MLGDRLTAGNFTFLVVPNAGHLVPTDKPKVARAMIENFVDGGAW